MALFAQPAGPVLVIAPHPDDEVLGCGGTIARLGDAGHDVHVAIVTRGRPPRFDDRAAAAVRREAEAAHALLGVRRSHYLDLPAAELDTLPHAEVNAAMARLFAEVQPAIVFLPFVGDIHLDHQIVFRSALVASRPRTDDYPLQIYAYETLSETNWAAPGLDPGFLPNFFVDIAASLDRKLRAFQAFASQVSPFPGERSIEALRALATLRGATVHCHAAEAFVLVREVVRS